MKLIALDVALLPPGPVNALATTLSASLPRKHSKGLRLDPAHPPHITLTQQFVREAELDEVLDRIDRVARDTPPLPLHVPGGGRGRSSVWMAVDPAPELVALHARLMDDLRGFERPAGGPGAFFEGDARPSDVIWVAGYRAKSSFTAYTPHITLGHAPGPPSIAPFKFTAATLAACHLGRFCTCRHVFRSWTLRA